MIKDIHLKINVGYQNVINLFVNHVKNRGNFRQFILVFALGKKDLESMIKIFLQKRNLKKSANVRVSGTDRERIDR